MPSTNDIGFDNQYTHFYNFHASENDVISVTIQVKNILLHLQIIDWLIDWLINRFQYYFPLWKAIYDICYCIYSCDKHSVNQNCGQSKLQHPIIICDGWTDSQIGTHMHQTE